MIQHKRTLLILLSLLATAAVVILASGLSAVDLDDGGQRLPSLPREGQMENGASAPSGFFNVAVRVFFIVAGAVFPFAVILYVVSSAARKRLLRDVIALLIVLLPLLLLWRAEPGTFEAVTEVQPFQGTVEDLPPTPEVADTPEPRQWLIVLATIVVALVLASLVVGVIWTIWRRRQRPPTSMDRLAQQAEDAIEAIQRGADLGDTVTRCYFEMMQVLKEERGLQRQSAMTPREFEDRLEEAGVPTTQVRRLTRLFEEVRYGDKHLGAEEERQAVVSLTSIVRYCRGAS